jgi:hypothetical protein
MPSLVNKKQVITAKDFRGKCKTEAARHKRRLMCDTWLAEPEVGLHGC